MNDAVDRVIAEREAMDRGLPGGLMVSGVAHVVLIVAALLAPLILPQEPPIKLIQGMMVELPRGGRGSPDAGPQAEVPEAPAPPVTAAPEPPKPEPVKPEPPPKIKKPPKEEPRKGLPEVDSKRGKKKPEKPSPASARAGGTGSAGQTKGFEFAPEGIGVPYGTDLNADWYMAAVQQRIWAIWVQQIKTGMDRPVTVSFTIQSDGSVTDVDVVQSSGAALLDLAAKRAVVSAAPFGPLPKHYGTERITIQGIFKPTS